MQVLKQCEASEQQHFFPSFREDFHHAQTLVSVARSLTLNIVIIAVGWIYAVAGIISFLPQVCGNVAL